jgi:hypothetical protein
MSGKKPSLWRRLLGAIRTEPKLGYLALGVLMFLVVTIGVHAWAWGLAPNTPQSNFALSLSSAFWEDTTFFFLVGILATLFNINRPGDENISNRVKYFFNGEHVTPGAQAHFVEELKKLGIFSPKYHADLTYTDFSVKCNAAKLTIQVDRTVVNMFSDQDFDSERHDYSMATDEVPGVMPQGELLDVYVDDGVTRKHILDAPCRIPKAGRKGHVDLSLPANTEVAVGYRAWIWHLVDQDYGFRPSRYTEKLTVTVNNRTGQTLVIKQHTDDREVQLTDGASATYEYDKVPGGELRTPFRLLGVKP